MNKLDEAQAKIILIILMYLANSWSAFKAESVAITVRAQHNLHYPFINLNYLN